MLDLWVRYTRVRRDRVCCLLRVQDEVPNIGTTFNFQNIAPVLATTTSTKRLTHGKNRKVRSEESDRLARFDIFRTMLIYVLHDSVMSHYIQL